MNPMQTWGGAIANSLLDLWIKFISFMPTLIGALLVFLFGVIIASILGKIIERLVKLTRADQALDRISIGGKLKEHGINITLSEFLGKLVQWFLVVVFLMAATDILGLVEVTKFLNSVVVYLPNVIVATIILAIAFLLAGVAYTIVRSSTKAAGVMSAGLLATIIRWSIVVFGLLAALVQLGIAKSLVNTIFIGAISAISLAVGLAFGLGGKDEAALILKKIRENISDNATEKKA